MAFDVRHYLSPEKKALVVSLLMTMWMSFLGITTGLLTDSNAILLDGIFSVISMFMTALGLLISFLISREDDKTFQFGYTHFEPLLNTFNGLILFGLCLYEIWVAVQLFADGGQFVQLNYALVYAGMSILICWLMYRYELRVAETTLSEIVRVDANEWLVDGLLSGALLLGFGFAYLLHYLDLAHLAIYMDPILTISLGLLACAVPIRVIKHNFREVLRLAPNDRMSERVDSVVADLQGSHGVVACESHLAKTGRRYDLEINILVSSYSDWSVPKQDRIREALLNRLQSKLDNLWLTVSFTEQKRWL
ncbi:MAG: cation diffusion facilitator family transporter [Shewanellaceae bacterium]|nr:cation diffusion facilitator family transporter [Shewanellaceae bacterium]